MAHYIVVVIIIVIIDIIEFTIYIARCHVETLCALRKTRGLDDTPRSCRKPVIVG